MRRGGGLDTLGLLCRAHGVPPPTREFRFAPPRRWRFDWAWPDERIAVEQEGGIWQRGRHTRGAGYLADLEKYNAAALLGWRVLRYSPQQIAAGEPVLRELTAALTAIRALHGDARPLEVGR